MDKDGLITIQSRYTPKETMQRLETAVKSKGMTVFARIDHAAGAKAVGLDLRPTELLIFGGAKAGTPLMQSFQTIGIDLGDVWSHYCTLNEDGPHARVAMEAGTHSIWTRP